MAVPGIDLRTLAPGFADPVLESQRCFRAVLDAMAHPGRRVPLSAALTPPAPLAPTTAAVALTLLDYDTPLWLAGDAATPPVADFLRFHAGCPLAGAPGAAAFALVIGAWPDLTDLPAGSDAYPDRSATLIAQCGALADGPLRLGGPGIDGTAGFGFSPMPAGFLAAWADNRTLFPRGVDVILTDRGSVAALPRTVAVTTEE